MTEQRIETEPRPVPAPVQAGADQVVPLPADHVRLLPLPYPYRAALAICSDLDETPDLHVYLQIMRYLNGSGGTAMGPGLELEVGNSMYFYMPPGQLAYWNTDDAGRETIRQLMLSGHIDVLHSFGDLATSRAHAAEALEELSRHDCRLEVWVDHAQAPTNFGADIMQGSGDVPGSPVYHADLTTAYGIKYVWRGRVTSTIGQNRPHDLGQVWTMRHPVASARTVAKEKVKHWVAALGNAKYAMHQSNRLLQSSRLRDGTATMEFLRFNPHWQGVQHGATADGLAEALGERVVDRLIERGGTSILYTHMGKIQDGRRPFDERTCASLRYLARRAHAGEILVTTTRRLLGYAASYERVRHSACRRGDTLILELSLDTRPTDPPGGGSLDGLTFTLPRAAGYEVRSNGRAVDHVVYQSSQDDRAVVGIPWKRLKWPGF